MSETVSRKRTGVSGAAWIVYAVIVFEIIYMISPFAFFYYSAYGLPLRAIQNNPLTSWLVAFLVPHYAHTRSPILHIPHMLGWPLISVGLLLFTVGFCQIYYSKFFKKQEVTGGLYTIVRHPQYVSLAVLGLGTLLVWPRFVILITFVTMIFLYYFLARIEEQECLNKFGNSYKDYMKKTGMFFPKLPFLPQVKTPPFSILPRAGVFRTISIVVLYIALISSTVVAGNALRSYSFKSIASSSTEFTYSISLSDLSEKEIAAITDTVLAGKAVQTAVTSGKLLLYIMPEEWHVPELPASTAKGHIMPKNYDKSKYKVLITEPVMHGSGATGDEIFEKTVSFEPLLLVYINTAESTVTKITEPPAAKWNSISVPLF